MNKNSRPLLAAILAFLHLKYYMFFESLGKGRNFLALFLLPISAPLGLKYSVFFARLEK